jgi:hypothetical protein
MLTIDSETANLKAGTYVSECLWEIPLDGRYDLVLSTKSEIRTESDGQANKPMSKAAVDRRFWGRTNGYQRTYRTIAEHNLNTRPDLPRGVDDLLEQLSVFPKIQ